MVILTTFERDDYILDAVKAGASGFLLKNTPPEELIAGVRAVAAGDALLSPSVTRRVLDRLAEVPSSAAAERRLRELTERETAVLRLLTEGVSNAEIAKSLILGEATVRPTSPTCCPSCISETGCRRWRSPTSRAWSAPPVATRPADERRPQHAR